jgi:hypothetical protein
MVLLEDCELPLSSRFGTINRCRLPVCGLISNELERFDPFSIEATVTLDGP